MLLSQKTLCYPIHLLAVLLLLAGLSSAAQAVLHDVTITGSVVGLDVPVDFILNDPDPVDGGETFTLTFQFDDAAPLSGGNGTTISDYAAAISNLDMTISNGVTVGVSEEGVLAADNGSNHQWSVFVFTGSPGFTSNLPDPLSVYNENSASDETFGLQALDVVLFDLTASVYQSTPPELVVPGAQFESPFVEIVWESFDSPGEFVRILTSVSGVNSTPVAAPVPALDLPALAALMSCAIAAGSLMLRRRRRA